MSSHLTATLVDDDTQLTLAELAHACRAAEAQVQVWVVEGVLQPSGNSPPEWRFTGASLRRARLAFEERPQAGLDIAPGAVGVSVGYLASDPGQLDSQRSAHQGISS